MFGHRPSVVRGGVGSVDEVRWAYPLSEGVGWGLILTVLMSLTIWDHKIWCPPTRSRMVTEKRWKISKKSDFWTLWPPTTPDKVDWENFTTHLKGPNETFNLVPISSLSDISEGRKVKKQKKIFFSTHSTLSGQGMKGVAGRELKFFLVIPLSILCRTLVLVSKVNAYFIFYL